MLGYGEIPIGLTNAAPLLGYEEKPKLVLLLGYGETYWMKAQNNDVAITREKPFVQGNSKLDLLLGCGETPLG
jgi:hypothetical protein